jgi:hypothetical protein
VPREQRSGDLGGIGDHGERAKEVGTNSDIADWSNYTNHLENPGFSFGISHVNTIMIDVINYIRSFRRFIYVRNGALVMTGGIHRKN